MHQIAMETKLVLKVTTDTKGQQLRLDNMPIAAAKAFLTLYEALVQLVELTDKTSTATISITQSSLATAVSGALTVNQMVSDFNSIIKSECDDSEKVKHWRDIQSLIQSNGLGYDILYQHNNRTESLVKKVKESKTFTKKRIKITYSSSIRFISGKLTDAGGRSKSNIHIDVSGGEVKVGCSEADAMSAAHYLYKNLDISAWVKIGTGGIYIYELCHVYENRQIFNELRLFFEELHGQEEIEALTMIHRRVKSYLMNEEFEKLRMFTKLLIHLSTDIQTMKIVLVLTKSFKGSDEFSSYREALLNIYNARFAKEMRQLKKTPKPA